MAAERRRYPDLATSWQPAPPGYWQQWRQELELADRILINSAWSRQCLLRAGVPAARLRIVPLSYACPSLLAAGSAEQPPAEQARGEQPLAARPGREPGAPLQLLFLGTIGLRKGVARLLEAMRLLEGAPVLLTLAGPTELDPICWADRPNVRWIGAVPRSRVGALYAAADALILPTLSDGFALTQLEALAHGCPVLASPFCGAVVQEGANGMMLPDLEPEAIAARIRGLVSQPLRLQGPQPQPGSSLYALADALLHLFEMP